MAKMPIKHKAKPSALLAMRQCTECFIWHIARARPYFNCFKELTNECLIKAYPFQLLPVRLHSSSWVRRFWMISYTNALVSRIILAELTWICHLVSLFTISFLHFTILYCNIALQMRFRCYKYYDKYSTEICFDIPTQSSLRMALAVKLKSAGKKEGRAAQVSVYSKAWGESRLSCSYSIMLQQLWTC